MLCSGAAGRWGLKWAGCCARGWWIATGQVRRMLRSGLLERWGRSGRDALLGAEGVLGAKWAGSCARGSWSIRSLVCEGPGKPEEWEVHD